MAKEKVEVPMTGKIISVEVKVGDQVKEDDVLCVLESMKMENPIVSPVKGKVIEVGVKAGDVADVGKMIAVIEY
jgi:biotin carboxyl carrier protein